MLSGPGCARGISRRDVITATGVGLTSSLAGCGYIGDTTADEQPLAKDSIPVGVLTPNNAIGGQSIIQGAELAVEQINDEGGIGGASLELSTADTAGEDHFEKAATEHSRLCTDEDCDLTLGLTSDGAVKETLPSIADNETVHLSSVLSDGSIGEMVGQNYDEYKYFFRAGLPAMAGLANALADFVEMQGANLEWETVAVVTTGLDLLTPFHDRLTERVSDQFEVAVDERISGLGGGYETLFDEIEDEGCDVLLWGSVTRGAGMVNAWANREPNFALGGFDLPAMRPNQWMETDGNVESMFVLDALTPASNNTATTSEFVTQYETTYEQYPMYNGALTYDALRMYRDAVEDLVESDGQFPDQDEIVETLEERTFTEGVVYPELAFTGPDADRVHEPVWESMAENDVPVIQQWQSGSDHHMEAIAPESNQTASYQSPPWFGE